MTKDCFKFCTTRSIEEWLDLSDDLLTKYRAHPNPIHDRLARALREETKLMLIMQKSCRLVDVTHRRDKPLYHYEMPGPHLTQLMLLDPEWVEYLKSITEHLLA